MTPSGVLDANGRVRKSSERSTSPFPSFWYVDFGLHTDVVLEWWKTKMVKVTKAYTIVEKVISTHRLGSGGVSCYSFSPYNNHDIITLIF